MARYIARRIGQTTLVMWLLTLLIFSLIHLAPGSPVDLLLGEQPTPERVKELTSKLGLDRPWHVQYLRYVGQLLRADLGKSIVFDEPVAKLVMERLPATVELAFSASVLTVLMSIPIGIFVALNRLTGYDSLGTIVALIGVSLPSFWLGFLLILVFAVDLGWFATSGRGVPLASGIAGLIRGHPEQLWGSLRYLVLPTIALGTWGAAFLSRLTRNSILEEMDKEYVRTAHAKGVSRSAVVLRHVLRNAILPVITAFGMQVGVLLGGAVVTETVFAWPGLGQLVYLAVSSRDYPLVQGSILVICFFTVALVLLVDLCSLIIDPRIRAR